MQPTPRAPARRPVSARAKLNNYKASSALIDTLGRTATPRHVLERDDVVGPAATRRGGLSSRMEKDPAGPPGRQLAGCIDESEAEGGQVYHELQSFEAKIHRCLVPTLVPPAMVKVNKPKTAKPSSGVGGRKRRGSDVESITSLQKQKIRRDELFDALRVRWHAKDAEKDAEEASEVHNGIHQVEGVNYSHYQKPLDLGTTKMMRWLLDLKALRQSDLVKELRKHYKICEVVPELLPETTLLPPGVPLLTDEERQKQKKLSSSGKGKSDQVPYKPILKKHDKVTLHVHQDQAIQRLRSHWLNHCKPSKTLTMPNATVAFVNFLQDALPSSYFVEKRQVEAMYQQLNDHRTQPLEYQQCFIKFILILTDLNECDPVALGHYMYLFFSTAYKVWNLDTDFAQTVDFQLIVSTFEDMTIGCLSDSAGSVTGEAASTAAGGADFSPAKSTAATTGNYSPPTNRQSGSPHKDTLRGLIECLKEDIMSGYSAKRNPRENIHIGAALDTFKDSTFIQMLRKRAPGMQPDGQFDSIVQSQKQGQGYETLALADVLLPRNPIPVLATDDDESELVKAPRKELTLLQKMLGHEEKNWEREMLTAPYYKKLQKNTRSFHTWVNDIFLAEARHIFLRLKPPVINSDIPGLKNR